MYKNKFTSAIITAAGLGKRMEADIPKLEIDLKGEPIINYTVEKFNKLKIFDEIILVTSSLLLEKYKKRYKDFENLKVILGGDTREESTFNGLKKLSKKSEIVVCHDGARPFVKKKTILASIDSAIKKGSGVAGVKSKDTIKIVNKDLVELTPNRENLYLIQTPQTFQTKIILDSYNKMYGKIKATDDASYLEANEENVFIVKGSYDNIKITTPEDLMLAKLIMEEK